MLCLSGRLRILRIRIWRRYYSFYLFNDTLIVLPRNAVLQLVCCFFIVAVVYFLHYLTLISYTENNNSHFKMSTIMLKGFGGAGILIAIEQLVLKKNFPWLYEVANFGLPKAFAGVILVNVVGSAFLLLSLGMKVGAARKKFDIALPKMYAEGDSEDAKKFNCVQRGHQQALETYPQYLAMSLIGGLFNPVGTTLAGIFWNVARSAWASGYATGNPDSRYGASSAIGIWYSLLYVIASAGSAALKTTGCI